MIKIKSFKAGKGDAFLLSFGKYEKKQKHIVIDMGFGTTYDDYIRNELKNLKRKTIDLLVVTHIDADHINGVLKFIKENGKSHKIVRVDKVWHNSYRHLQFDKDKKKSISKEEKELLIEMIRRNLPMNNDSGYSDISSYTQGSSLARYLYEYKYNWNSKAIVAEGINLKKIGDINIILLSPNKDKLKNLSSNWLNMLEDEQYDFTISNETIFDDAFEFSYMHQRDSKSKISPISSTNKLNFEELSKIKGQDSSTTNGSSIAFIIEYKNKKLLFLGDAHEDIIFENLYRLKNSGYDLTFDLVKLSHHGSNENISNRLLNIIEAKRFLISTEGIYYKHPHIEAISKIIMKKTEYTKKIIFNYNLSIIDKLNKIKYREEIYKYKAVYLEEVVIDDF